MKSKNSKHKGTNVNLKLKDEIRLFEDMEGAKTERKKKRKNKKPKQPKKHRAERNVNRATRLKNREVRERDED